ncbi:MAG: D-2-hydroxyacid dehydrogenase [Opitutales bacterium]
MKIIALDGHSLNPGDNRWEPVEALGDLTVYPRSRNKEVLERAAGAEVIIANKVPLPREVIENLPALRFITISATGYNIVDIDAARERGIPVSNVPGYSSDSVAQHTFALLLELTNQTGDHDASVQRGEWTRCPDFAYWLRSIPELAGKTIGIIGFGDIGRRVARIALAFGMNVLAHSRTRKDPLADEKFGWADLDELAARADVVSLHCPQTPETAGMIDAAFLKRMKPSAYLINTARGGLVVERDLANALREGRLAGAAVDVVSAEPMREDNPLLGCPNCIVTPHLAWATLEARQRLMRVTAENIAAFQCGEPVNVVNGVGV